MSKGLDPRVIRTRRLLMDALINIVAEDGYEAVTIREIVRKAKVNRSTFYLHFRDKEDIVTQMQDDLLNMLTESLKYPTYTYESAKEDYKKSNKPIKSLVAMFEHIQMYSSLYRSLLGKMEFRNRVTKVFIDEVLRFKDSFWEANFMANGTVGFIHYWLENGMKESIMEMSSWLTQAILFPLAKFK
ncbi:TetR/AcrR family transcriptional regulator [Virgibacillus oceani]|uniref:TetR family transcriptional regulator n=1 Tax=Virgibacillus oceani TaxID=1479511 RepID=A0A917M4T0_9BACI|nr:TetR/AcrR family transcriptional regulator [Virgibacillus oceani]GGG78788.1 TetR family transcriptional regulator [Virgibacillus oceani]